MEHMKSGLQILIENYEGRDKQFRRHRRKRTLKWNLGKNGIVSNVFSWLWRGSSGEMVEQAAAYFGKSNV